MSPDFGPALGSGPFYAVGIDRAGDLHYGQGESEGGWIYAKVLWVSRSDDDQPARDTGESQLDKRYPAAP